MAKHHVRRILRVLQIGILVPEHVVEFYATPNYELPCQSGMKTRNLAIGIEITSATFLALGLTLILLRLKTRNLNLNLPNYESCIDTLLIGEMRKRLVKLACPSQLQFFGCSRTQAIRSL
jgi:hypothetical protein